MLDRLKSAWGAGSEDNISLVAAGIAHYALLALVPALGAAVLGYGLFADPATVARHIGGLAEMLPQSAAELIGDQLQQVSQGADGSKGLGLVAAVALALFGARGAAQAMISGFNIVFDVECPRGFLRANLVALAITLGGLLGLGAAGTLAALAASILGPIASIASVALLLMIAAAGAAVLYHYAPGGPRPDWTACWTGAGVFAVLWNLATIAFAAYAANFTDYNATYGSLGAVIALITWFWVSAFALLFGAEIVALETGRREAR